MAVTEFPWFPIYADETLSDENFTVWPLCQRGAWVTLLLHCWKSGSIPSDIERLSRLCGCNAQEMQEHWSGIADRFHPHPDSTDRLISLRLEFERQKAVELANSRSEHGKRAANSRWEKYKAAMLEHSSGSAEAMPNDTLYPYPYPNLKDVPPTPLQGEKRKRRTRGQILEPYSEAVRSVANAVLAKGFWRQQDPDGRPINQDPAQLCIQLDLIFQQNPDLSPETLIQAAHNYLEKPRKSYSAAQWFFGTGTKDKPAHWVAETRMIQHQASRKAETAGKVEG
jgi:hypothetical protein